MRFHGFILLLLFIPGLLPGQEDKNPEKGSELDAYYKTVKWRNIGPFRGGRSVSASGVIGDPLTYYMGTTGGGLWKTEDAGQHWSNISDGYFKTGSVGAVAVSTSDPNIVYVGMGEHAPRGVMTSHGDGVYKSTDAGKSWKHMGLEATQHISRIIIHPKDPNLVYVAAQGALHGPNPERGIYKSTDGGESWEQILFVNNLTGCSELSMDLHNTQVLYAAMWEHQRLPWKVVSGGEGSGLYKSTDGGKSWNKIHKGLPKEMGKMAIAVSPANPEKVYALIESDSDKEKGGLFVSGNAGKSWSRISKDHRLMQRAWYYIEVFPDPQDEHTVYVLSASALRSIDGGKSWETIRGTHGDHHDLWINPHNPKNLCIANDGGAAISFNQGKSWSRQDNMPTIQFYRVNVDNDFPYNVYGGQQDNTSVKIASREFNSGGITLRSWSYSAGGESAFLAFDPDNPRYVMGGSYLGTINLLDTKAQAGTKVMAAPIQYLGREARDMKYLYNWNAPIIWSQHEPNTFYHGAQYLLKSSDMGKSWKEVSPDLTRNQDDKQGNGGGPYTNEAVGAENYGTLSYVVESPHEKGVIWTGSDDGYVQLTRDGGENWKNVTPKGLEECLINAIEVSPHDPATAYIATTRYKFNDKTPGIYKTTNYGKSWTNISEGIPMGAYTRVIREDDKRKDLLFTGTEAGLYLSWDGGKAWEPFQLNLPVTPVLDMIIRHDDLILATSGRGFWILDDLSLIRQKGMKTAGAKLFKPEDTYMVAGYTFSQLDRTNPEFTGMQPFQGVNPATGVVMYYELPKLADSVQVEMEIRDASGSLVNSYSSTADKSFRRYPGGPSPAPLLSKKEGLNRFVWNMRHKSMAGATNVYVEGSYSGHKVSPGTFDLLLKVGETEHKTKFTIKPNPLYPKDIDYAGYHKMMSEMEANLSEMHLIINSLYKKMNQINEVMPMLSKEKKHADLKKEAKELVAKIKAWDEDMVQRKSKAYDDVENFPNKFTANYLFLINQTESAIPKVNQGSIDRRKELDAKWEKLSARGKELQEAIPAFNKKLWEAGVGAIWK
ncbi:MAG: glycosyl hydrolase [Bacteroidota bacterium]